MGRRKNTRMFSRAERREARVAQLARAGAVTQEELDRATVAGYLGSEPAPVDWALVAEAWLALRDEPDPTDEEREALAALGRTFERLMNEPVEGCGELLESYREDLERREELGW